MKVKQGETLPKCPRCKTNHRTTVQGFRLYRCGECGGLYDGENDGDVGYGPPDRRINRQERAAGRTIRGLFTRRAR